MRVNNWLPDTVCYREPNDVAVIFDPEGGQHVCRDITDIRFDSSSRYWCAGMIGNSPGELADRLHKQWWDDSVNDEGTYLRQLAAFGENE
jgi:hypothetical protein